MKIKLSGLLIIALTFFGLIACIDEENSDEVIYQKDQKAIKEYIEANQIVNVKEFEDARGFTVIWQELSNSGIDVKVGDTIRTNYTGKLLSKQIFDTSIESVAKANNIYTSSRRYEPLKFRTGLGLVIPGFELGLLLLEQGDKATIFMPSLLGYGANPPQGIPVNAPLIFEVELVQVKEGPRQ